MHFSSAVSWSRTAVGHHWRRVGRQFPPYQPFTLAHQHTTSRLNSGASGGVTGRRIGTSAWSGTGPEPGRADDL